MMGALREGVAGGSLFNPDLAPTRPEDRTWGLWNFAALWVAMSVCIPTYMLASSMVAAGMNWWQSLLAILLGNAIVLVPLVVNGHAGTRYGVPFPVFARAAFGVRGAHLPSLLRSLVACGWFGIQTWIGGLAIHAIVGVVWPGWTRLFGDVTFMGYGLDQYLSFLVFWLINMYFVWAGTESIRWLETLAAPFLIVMGIALLLWASSRAGGIGAMLSASQQLVGTTEMSSWRFFLKVFLPWLTAMVGYWATLSLNIPDFSRYARSQKDQMAGQALGLLITMPLFAFIGIAVTGATLILFDEAIWNPVDLLARLTAESESPILGLGALLVLVVATLSTNIAANVVSPANSFSNLMPRSISFRLGGLLAGAVGILIFPWVLLDRYQTWLISYSGLLGAVAGVLVCDYLVVRRLVLDVDDLYDSRGRYSYQSGFNRAALWAFGLGLLVALSGKVDSRLDFLFSGAWFSAAAVSFTTYWILMRSSCERQGDT